MQLLNYYFVHCYFTNQLIGNPPAFINVVIMQNEGDNASRSSTTECESPTKEMQQPFTIDDTLNIPFSNTTFKFTLVTVITRYYSSATNRMLPHLLVC